MSNLRWIAIPLIVGLSLPTVDCGMVRRRANVSTNVSSSVQINQQGRDVATLEREEYEVIGSSTGTDKSRLFYVLTIPVGSQTSSSEGESNAYAAAVDRNSECDALMMPRVDTKRSIIPLLLINIVIRKTVVKGRCIHIKEDDVLRAEQAGRFEDEGASDTGGGGDVEVEAEVEAPPAKAGGDGPEPAAGT